MKSKYLINDPIPWLLEKVDPSIRYLTIKEIIGENPTGEDYNELFSCPEIIRLLDSSQENILGDHRNHDLYYKGTAWCFAEAVSRGLDNRTEIISNTGHFLIQQSQSPDGGFGFNWSPCLPVACRTGDMLKYLFFAGVRNEDIQKNIQWIIYHQRHDGGWLHCPLENSCDSIKLVFLHKPGNGLRRENNPTVKSCIYATASCTEALLHCKEEYPSREIDLAIDQACEYFLSKKLYLDSKGKPIRPKQAWNKDFRLLGYPVFSQYDILHGMLIISMSGRFNDSRAGEVFNIIISKQNQDGTWNIENSGTGMLKDLTRKNKINSKNKWITLKVLKMLKESMKK